MSASTVPVKFRVKPGTTRAGIPVSRIASRSARGFFAASSAARCGNTPGYRTGSSPASSGWVTYCGEPLVVGGRQRVPPVLLPERDQDLVEQRVAQPRYLPERPAGHVLAVVRVPQRDPLTAGRGPHADGRVPLPGHRRDRHLDRDRMHVQVVGGVHPGRGRQFQAGDVERGVQVLERPQVGQVEDRAQVDVEGFGPLPGEHPDPATQIMDRGGGDARVVPGRRGQRPDVAGRAGQPGAQGARRPPVHAR